MFTSIDKAIVAALVTFLAQGILNDKGGAPVEFIFDLDTWLRAAATAALVWAVPNREYRSNG